MMLLSMERQMSDHLTDWKAKKRIAELEARIEELEYVIQMTHASIHCYDGYRGIGISEEAEALLNKTLAAKEQGDSNAD